MVSLPHSLTGNVDQHAIGLFFQDYIIDSCDRCPGFLNFLPSLYLKATEKSLLRIAVFATAYANLAQKTERPDITIKALSYYRRALQIVNTVLSENLETTSDSTMTAVMLLGLYEVNMLSILIISEQELTFAIFSTSILRCQTTTIHTTAKDLLY